MPPPWTGANACPRQLGQPEDALPTSPQPRRRARLAPWGEKKSLGSIERAEACVVERAEARVLEHAEARVLMRARGAGEAVLALFSSFGAAQTPSSGLWGCAQPVFGLSKDSGASVEPAALTVDRG